MRSANADAVTYLTRGVDVLASLPEGADGERHELALLLALGPAIQAAKGLGAPEAERVFVRARELSERFGETAAAFQALWGQWMFSVGQGRMVPARRIGEELITLARRSNDRALVLEAHHAMWATSFWLGELAAAHGHAEQGKTLYDREQDRSLAFLYGGHDPGVCGLTFAALTHWMLGRPVQAVATIEAAIALAEQLAHPPTSAIALTWACILHYFAPDARATGHYARQVITVSTEHDLPPWRAAGVLFEGWSRAESGDGGAGVAQVHEGLVAAAQTKGTLMPLEPLYMLVLGDARLKHGQIEEGLRVIDDALAVMASRGEGAFLSEFHRLKGELVLLRSPSNHGPGEACFRQALDVARQQGANSWELRAATSLGRLLAHTGRQSEARQILGEVCGRLTEGFDTTDMKDAKALLDQLAA